MEDEELFWEETIETLELFEGWFSDEDSEFVSGGEILSR